MERSCDPKRWFGAILLLGSAASLLGSSGGCFSPESLRILIVGLDAAAGQVEQNNRDVTFGDWLDSEFGDVFDDL